MWLTFDKPQYECFIHVIGEITANQLMEECSYGSWRYNIRTEKKYISSRTPCYIGEDILTARYFLWGDRTHPDIKFNDDCTFQMGHLSSSEIKSMEQLSVDPEIGCAEEYYEGSDFS